MAPSLMSHDVVITTYGTLTAEKNRKVKHSCDEDQPLLSHSWYRIVLDEGKNQCLYETYDLSPHRMLIQYQLMLYEMLLRNNVPLHAL